MIGHRNTILLSCLASIATACSPANGSKEMDTPGEMHFTCAAMISAADHLIAAGRLSPGEVPIEMAPFAAMTHLNAWAIPKGLAEADAFDAVNKERAKLVAELSPAEIAARAKRCLEKGV